MDGRANTKRKAVEKLKVSELILVRKLQLAAEDDDVNYFLRRQDNETLDILDDLLDRISAEIDTVRNMRRNKYTS